MKPSKRRITPGVYRHYKGNTYSVFVTVTHTESNDELVVYASNSGDKTLWARPLSLFVESVVVSGSAVPRFAFLRPFEGDE